MASRAPTLPHAFPHRHRWSRSLPGWRRRWRWLLVAVGPARLIAQIEGERGIAPAGHRRRDIRSARASKVDTSRARPQQEARAGGLEGSGSGLAWETDQADRRWAIRSRSTPSCLGIVVIEREQIGPRRYVATAWRAVRSRQASADYLGNANGQPRTFALGTAAGTADPLFGRHRGNTDRLRACAGHGSAPGPDFQTGCQPVSTMCGQSGSEWRIAAILTAGQAGRRSRLWWRNASRSVQRLGRA